jgi:60 kDa SS-A/Ro ribonucleoprotein
MASGAVAGVPGLTPRVAAAAMALVTAAREPRHQIMAFQDEFVPLGISPRERLDDVVRRTNGLRFGRTDCALPMRFAMERTIPVDVFLVLTDSETWYGDVHPVQALRQYRERMGIPAKLIVAAFVANRFSIADPDDAGMLDVVGFDTAVPSLIRDFAIS